MIQAILCLAPMLAPDVTVDLSMEAQVRGTEVELGEIASVVGSDAATVARVEAVALGYAPAPGYSRLLARDKVALALSRALPDVEVRFAGQRACRVRPEVVEIAELELRAVARAELARRFAGQDASFELADPIPRITVPAGVQKPILHASIDLDELVGGTINVPVEILVDDAIYRTVWTTWKAEIYQTMAVLGREVRAGEVLRPEMFERRRVELTSARHAKGLSAERLVGSVAARDLSAGEVVGSMDVHRPTVLTAGSSVFVRVRKGLIRARVPAQALESGAVGDRVRVRTNESGQELFGRVVSRDLVEVVL